MSQHDFTIDNQGFPAFRADLNNALQALASNSAGTAEPSPTFAFQFWMDSTNNLLKMRNADNDAWIAMAYFDQVNDKWELRTDSIQAVNGNGLVFQTDDGLTRLEISDNGDVSFYEDTGTTAKFFWDASAESLGIGTTTPASVLHLYSTDPKLTFEDSNNGYDTSISGNNGYITYDAYSSSRDHIFTAAGVERARITGDGQVLVGKDTGDINTTGTVITINGVSASRDPSTGGNIQSNFIGYTSGTYHHMRFKSDGITVGSVTQTGTTIGYNTSSDYRLKEDWQPMQSNWDRVKALKPVNFAWKSTGERVDGFLAHELQEVIPEAVTGTKDATQTEEYEVSPAVLDDEGNVITEAVMGTREVPDYQGIDQSKLVPLLTAALQDAIAKIEALEARVDALENA